MAGRLQTMICQFARYRFLPRSFSQQTIIRHAASLSRQTCRGSGCLYPDVGPRSGRVCEPVVAAQNRSRSRLEVLVSLEVILHEPFNLGILYLAVHYGE